LNNLSGEIQYHEREKGERERKREGREGRERREGRGGRERGVRERETR